MSKWSHLLCWDCWRSLEPHRVAHRVIDAKPDRCCMCGALTDSGIFRRADPDVFPCRGYHTWDTDD